MNDEFVIDKPISADRVRDEVEKVVAEEVPNLVHQVVLKEEERRFRQLKWIVAFIGLIGLGTFGTLATFMIEKAVDMKAGGIREYLELTRINALALKLTVGKSFSSGERDEAMALLMRIAKSPSVKSSPDVKAALSDVLRSFTSAGLEAEVDQLFNTYGDEILVSGVSSEILLHHYGQQIVGRIAKPSTDDFDLKAFERLERGAEGHNVLELALAYRVLFESSKKADEATIERMVAATLDLSERDAIRFLREILTRTRVENWQTEPTVEGRNIERTTRDFFSSYKSALVRAYGVSADVVDDIALRGVEDPEDAKLASEVVRRARTRTRS